MNSLPSTKKDFKKGMGMFQSTEISISELVSESNLIVKVKFIESFKESIPVSDRSNDQNKTLIPPFIKQGCIFQVFTVLKNTARIEVPERIQVPNENWRRSFSQHKQVHAGGSSKSFTIPTYKTEVTSLKKAAILFLHHFQGMFDLTAKDSFENPGAEEKITMLLGNDE